MSDKFKIPQGAAARENNISNDNYWNVRLNIYWLMVYDTLMLTDWDPTMARHRLGIRPLYYISSLDHEGCDSNFIPLRATYRGNINIYLHFVPFLHIDRTQVVEILPQIRQEPTYST